MAYEMNTEESCMGTADILESLAAKVAVASRLAQKSLRGQMDDSLRAVFRIGDAYVSTIGRCMAGDLGNNAVCSPLMVPLELFEKMEMQLASMKAHQLDVNALGHSVHFAQKACELNRGSKAQHQYLQEKLIHKQAAVARHVWTPLTETQKGSTIFLENLVALPGAIPPPPLSSPLEARNDIQIDDDSMEFSLHEEDIDSHDDQWHTKTSRCKRRSRLSGMPHRKRTETADTIQVNDPWKGQSLGGPISNSKSVSNCTKNSKCAWTVPQDESKNAACASIESECVLQEDWSTNSLHVENAMQCASSVVDSVGSLESPTVVQVSAFQLRLNEINKQCEMDLKATVDQASIDANI